MNNEEFEILNWISFYKNVVRLILHQFYISGTKEMFFMSSYNKVKAGCARPRPTERAQFQTRALSF